VKRDVDGMWNTPVPGDIPWRGKSAIPSRNVRHPGCRQAGVGYWRCRIFCRLQYFHFFRHSFTANATTATVQHSFGSAFRCIVSKRCKL